MGLNVLPGDPDAGGRQRRPGMGSAVVHFDISGPNPEELQKFYGEVFGWKITPVPELQYALVDTEGGSGINGGIGPAREGPGQGAFYVMGDDLQVPLDRGESHGGKTTRPGMTTPARCPRGRLPYSSGTVVARVGG